MMIFEMLLYNGDFDAQWIDREGKTPLIVACMNPELYNVAKILIELGANVNAYRPGMFSLWVFIVFHILQNRFYMNVFR